MSGIVGIYHREQDRDAPEQLIRRMIGALHHRGSDHESIIVGKGAGFGHCSSRTSEFFAKNEDIVVCLDGAIYNEPELRKDLSSRHQLQNDNVGEIISHLYEETGTDCVSKLRGMFAIALFDRKSGSLLLARDRLGEKPLVYAEVGESIYFASEIRPLLMVPGINREIDLEGLHHYFAYQTYIPAPYTIFRRIRKLPLATYLLATRKHIQLKRYWEIDYRKKLDIPLQDCCEEYRRLLSEIVKMQTGGRDSVGVPLSGGVDSSSIAAVLSKQTTSPVKTFAIGYNTGGVEDPELARARRVAQLLGTEHHELIYHPNVGGALATTVDSYGGSLVNQFPILYLCPLVDAIAKEVPVALCGNGADEEFGGYTGYLAWRKLDIIREIAKPVPQPLLSLLSSAGHRVFRTTRASTASRLMAKLPQSKLLADNINMFGQIIAQDLYSPTFLAATKDVETGKPIEDALDEAHTSTLLESNLHLGLVLKSLPAIIIWEATGANNSLEIRNPFLDHRMVEFAASLPTKYKVPSLIRSQSNKLIMKEAMRGTLPLDILFTKKMGFGYSIHWIDWLETRWSNTVRKLLLRGSLQDSGLFNMRYIESILNGRTTDRSNWATLVWGLVNLEIWCQIYMLGKDPREIDAPFD